MQKELYNSLKNTKSIKEARVLITDRIVDFNNIVKEQLKDADYSYSIDYGMHEFPEKVYKGVTYEEGEYESVIITIGDGNGKNFWCVLFPPLCMLDEDSNIEYSSLVKEIIDKYF